MNYQVTHITTYSGSEPVSVCHNQSWLRPRNLTHQTCDDFSLKISPEPSVRSDWTDHFGNTVDFFSFNQGYDSLEVTASSQLTLHQRDSISQKSIAWENLRDSVATQRDSRSLDAYQFTFESPRIRMNSEFAEYARKAFKPGIDIANGALELTSQIFRDFEFDARATIVTTPVEEVFRCRKGVCQDFAHLQIALLRSIQIPVRYVSGYLRTLPPPGQERLIGADASHAWVSVYCGQEAGWIDFDPTNNLITGTDHITVAWGRDYGDIPPLKGVFIGGGTHSLKVSVDVAPDE